MIPNPVVTALAAIALFAIALTALALFIVNTFISIFVWLFLVSKIAAVTIWRQVKPWLK